MSGAAAPRLGTTSYGSERGPLPRRVHLRLLLAALAGASVAVVALRMRWTLQPAGVWMWALLAASALAAGWELRRIEHWMPEPPAPEHPARATLRRSRATALAALGAAALIVGLVMAHLWPDYHNRWHGTVLPWVAALGLTFAAGLLFGRTDAGWHRCAGAGPETGTPTVLREAGCGGRPLLAEGAWSLPRWLEVAAFVLIATVALGVRVYHIDRIPAGIYVDETNGGLDALYILEGRGDSPFGTGWYGTPTGYVYYMVAIFKVFGANWYSLKFVSLLPAFLTVLAIYPLGRLLFGPVGGLSAMAFLAVNRWHMSMSRWGWNEVVPPLFQILATFFLLRGLRDRRSSDFVAGGLISGLMMYTYLSSRLALATLGVFAIYFLLVAEDGPIAAWRRHWRGLVLFLVAWGVAIGPIAVTHITEPFTFSNRVAEISVFKDVKDQGSYRPLWLNLRDHVKVFHQIGDHQPKHNLPDEPQADPVVGMLFAVGLGQALWRLRDHRRGLLWLWLLFGMAGGVFSSNHESPQSYRTLTAAPALVLFAAAALEPLARAACHAALGSSGAVHRSGQTRWRSVLAGAVVVGAWSFSGIWETHVYFGAQANSPSVQAGFNPVENGVARDVLRALSHGDSVFLSPHFYGFSPLRFLAYGVEKRRTGRNTLENPPWGLLSLEQDLPLASTDHDMLLLLDIQFRPLMDFLRRFYPDAATSLALGPDGVPMYVRVRLTRPEIASAEGLVETLSSRNGTSRQRVVGTVDAQDTTGELRRITWSGTLRVERAGDYRVSAGRGPTVSVDNTAMTGPRFLCRGVHDLDVAWPDPAATAAPRLTWAPPGAGWQPIPPRLLFQLRQPDEGLVGFYYPNASWQGEPTFTRLTPFFMLDWIEPDPIPGHIEFSARFVGQLLTSEAGKYRFRVEADDGATLLIDGTTIGQVVINGADSFPTEVELSSGEHTVEICYYQLGGGSSLEVYWQPPGAPEALIPPEALRPPSP